MTRDLPEILIRFSESLDGTFLLEDMRNGGRYFDMLPHEICQFFEAMQEQYNLDGMSLPANEKER